MKDLYHKIVKGLEYWHHRNPHCNNWWYNQIAEPQKLSILLIQMQMLVKGRFRKYWRQRSATYAEGRRTSCQMDWSQPDGYCLHWIYRACLQKNDVDLKTAVENVYSPLSYTVKEGFQHDNSYFQHGVQLYIGGLWRRNTERSNTGSSLHQRNEICIGR